MKYIKLFEEFISEKLEWNDSDAPDANGKFKDLSIEDLAAWLIKTRKKDLTKITGSIWNLGSGNPQSVKKLVQLLNPKKIIFIPKRPGEPNITYANIKKIQKDLNWKPAIPFEEGVSKILDNIEYWRNAPLWNKSNIAKETKLWFKYLK